MKKFFASLAIMLVTMVTSASAMSYEQAREQALFLTDKMAYELNLTESQYEAAYEVNLDYLMGVNSYDDVYADCWTRRNLDLSYILLDWQYRMFCDATYFYRPIWWEGGYWHFGIYARYPHRDHFYFGRPGFYVSYRGGHSWHHNGGASWYHGHFTTPHHGGVHSGMRDGWNRGSYNHGATRGNERNHGITSGSNRADRGNGSYNRGNNSSRSDRGNSSFNRGDNSNRQSSTRTTVGGGSFDRGSRSGGSYSSPSRSSSSSMGGGSSMSRGSSMGGGSRGGSSMGAGSHSGGSSHAGGSSHSGGSRGAGGRR